MIINNNFTKGIAFGLILLFTFFVLFMLKDYLSIIFGSVIFSYLMFPIYKYFLKKTKNKEITSSLLSLLFFFLIVAIPVFLMSGFLISEISKVDVTSLDVVDYEETIEEVLGVKVSISENLNRIKNFFTQSIPRIISISTNFLVSIFILFFIMFYLLIEHKRFIKGSIAILPFSAKNSKHLIDESGKMTKALLYGQLLVAVVQGVLGMISFFIVGINNAFFWGLIMIFLSIIPIVGAFIIWIPVGIFLLVQGEIWQGVFIMLWGFFIVSQIDNVIRPRIVNRFADIHPLETLVGVIAGISFFGIIGIFIGPLVISFLRILIETFAKEYGSFK